MTAFIINLKVCNLTDTMFWRSTNSYNSGKKSTSTVHHWHSFTLINDIEHRLVLAKWNSTIKHLHHVRSLSCYILHTDNITQLLQVIKVQHFKTIVLLRTNTTQKKKVFLTCFDYLITTFSIACQFSKVLKYFCL